MPQGISPNPLNKISEVYLSQISEHHKKDADGNTIPHEGEEVEDESLRYMRKENVVVRCVRKVTKVHHHHKILQTLQETAKEETEIGEAKVDQGRSDYGKDLSETIEEWPGHGEPGMFDPEGKRGKL